MKVAIIGAGNVGKALTTSFTRAGYDVTISSADPEHARKAADALGATAARTNQDAVAGADLVVLAVPTAKLGDIATDILAVHSGPIAVGSDTAATISRTGGGSAANTATWLVHAGVDAELVGVVGRDAAGAELLAELVRAGVGVRAVRRSGQARTGSVIVLAHSDERSFLCDRGANLLLKPSDVDIALAGPVGHLHLSGYTLFDANSRAAGVQWGGRKGPPAQVSASSLHNLQAPR